MAIDPIDIARQEARRADEKRTDRKREKEVLKTKAAPSFLTQYHSKLKEKVKETTESKGKDGEKGKKEEEGNLFSKIIEVFRKKEDSGDQESRKFSRKEKDKKEADFKGGEERPHSRSEETHARVEGTQSSKDQGGGSGGGGPSYGGGGGGSQGGGSSSGGGGQGGKDSGSGGSKERQASPYAVGRIAGTQFTDSGDQSSNSRHFSQKTLDEIVTQVTLGVNQQGNTEMEIRLSDDYFDGLKLKVSETSHGILLTFICPNRVVKSTFLIHRPKIYSSLKEKNIRIFRIDIE